jgi:starch synthase
MQVCSVSAEMGPWSKTGGLGDVAGALPVALAARGHTVLAVAPRYKAYDDAWDTGIRLRLPLWGVVHEVALFHRQERGVDRVFVDHPAIRRGQIYGDDLGAYQDNLFRFALLSRAGIEAARHLPLDRPLTSRGPVSFLAHDWHAGLLPTYLEAHYRSQGLLMDARCAVVIHNLAYQGNYPAGDFAGLDLPAWTWPQLDMGGRINCLKAGIATAERVLTVSRGYADEIRTPEHGFGLDGLLRARGGAVSGIVNGIDAAEWDPTADPHLAASYSATDLEGKAACKQALQAELGLPERPDVPMLCFIGRLDPQKGVDLVAGISEWLLGQDVQLVLLGTGRPDLEGFLRHVGQRWPSRARGVVGFSTPMAHRMVAGSDLLLMPSRFEPCGLNQLHALRYGTVPVVHATGGLRDTVAPFHPFPDRGTGWLFGRPTTDALAEAVNHALRTYWDHPESFRGLQQRGMAEDVGWDSSAMAYEALLTGMHG